MEKESAIMEKEIDVLLLDHLHSLKRLKKIAEKNNDSEMAEAIAEEISNVNEKLYRKPPVVNQ